MVALARTFSRISRTWARSRKSRACEQNFQSNNLTISDFISQARIELSWNAENSYNDYATYDYAEVQLNDRHAYTNVA